MMDVFYAEMWFIIYTETHRQRIEHSNLFTIKLFVFVNFTNDQFFLWPMKSIHVCQTLDPGHGTIVMDTGNPLGFVTPLSLYQLESI